MPTLDDIPSSPLRPGASLEESLKYYKAQYEILEAELADFQSSSKDLEAELEKDIEASEKRERQLKDKATNLQYEVDEWKEKYKQSKNETGATQNRLQKEITDLRDQNRTLQLRLRDIEVANDDYERQQRNTESSLEDMQAQYDKTFEKTVILEQEVQTIEQERETLRIDVQRLKDELQDFKIEAEIVKERLKKAEQELERRTAPIAVQSVQASISPRSEVSPTTTNTSTPSFDTPPTKTASSSGISDTPTPPSPPMSEKSTHSSKAFATPVMTKPRMSLNAQATPRQSTYQTRPNGHTRGLSVAAKSSSYRQSLSKTPGIPPKATGLPQSSSIVQLRNLRGKMQKLEQRVQNARSKLPAPVSTPPRASPRPGSALDQQEIPSSITMRSRKRTTGSSIGPSSLPDNNSDGQSTPSIPKTRASRQSLTQHLSHTTSPSRLSNVMPPPRPSSRASGVASRQSTFVPAHSRPGSRASVSNFKAPLGGSMSGQFTPNASTDRVRPTSALSDYRRTTYDGTFENDHPDETIEPAAAAAIDADDINKMSATPTPRRTTLVKPRTSDIGSSSAIPTPLANKRASLSGFSRLPGPNLTRRQSNVGANVSRPESRTGASTPATVGGGGGGGGGGGDMRPPSRALGEVKQRYDINETF